jgi:hypothetical protein
METHLNKLPEDFKKRWIAALRSGEYKQGKHKLHRTEDGSYCCLGVACKISGVSNEVLSQYVYTGIIDTLYPGLIPKVIVKGFINDVAHELANMNDKEGKSFSEIADYIESNL